MIEIPVLAASLITSFFVPLFKKGAEGLVTDLKDRIGEDLAEGVASEAKSLWQKLKDKVSGSSDDADAKPPEQEAAETFERAPDLMKQPLEEILKQLLEDDPDFRRAAEELVAKDPTATGGTTLNITTGDHANVNTAQAQNVSGGTVAGAIIHNAPSRPPTPPVDPPPPPITG